MRKLLIFCILICLSFVAGCTVTPPTNTEKFIVSFDTDGGEPLESIRVSSGEVIALPIPTKENYIFTGWELEGEGPYYQYEITGHMTFKATWMIKVETLKYTITFDTNGGDNISPLEVQFKSEVQLPVPTREGYKFIGWEYEGELVGESYLITKNITFIARWEKDVISYNVAFDTSGGEALSSVLVEENTDFILPTPKKDGYIFMGWKCNGNGPYYKFKITSDITFVATWTTEEEYYDDYEINKIKFDGQGMEYVIKVLPVSDYDPFDKEFTGDYKALMQAHQRYVESAYNIKIVYSEWENEAPWGPDRIEFIKKSVLDGTFKKNNVFVVDIFSQWIPTLVKENILSELYDMNNNQGFFADNGYVQDEYDNEASSVKGKVYGYAIEKSRPQSFIFYNATKVSEIGMVDPAELWLKGEWNWSNFEQWIYEAQSKLGEHEYALDLSYYDYLMGASLAQGLPLIDSKTNKINFTSDEICSIILKFREFRNAGIQNRTHGVQDVTREFVNGETLLHSGTLWFLKESTRFTPAEEDGGIQFNIGIVPYPISDDAVVNTYTEPYTYLDTDNNVINVNKPIYKRDGQPLMNKDGKLIYGIDLSKSNYLNPISIDDSGEPCYAVINQDDSNTSGITNSVIFSILHDLQYPINKLINKNMTSDESYQKYLSTKIDYSIDLDVVMSVQDSVLKYYDLLPIISMTAGYGSHFQHNGFIYFISGFFFGEEDPKTKLQEIYQIYEDTLNEIK